MREVESESTSCKIWRWMTQMTHARNAPLNREKCWVKGRGLCSSKVLSLTGAPDSSSGVTEQHAQPHESRSEQNTHNSLLYGQRKRTAVTGDRSDSDRRILMVTHQWRCRERFLSFFRWIVSVCYGGISPQLSVCAPGQPTPMKSCSYMQSERLWSGIRFLCVLWIKTLAGFDTCNLWIFPPGLMTNMELPGRCMLFAALVMSVPHPACSGQCLNYSPARAIKTSWLVVNQTGTPAVRRTDWYGGMRMIWICKTKPNFACAYTPSKMLLNPAKMHSDWFWNCRILKHVKSAFIFLG